VRFSTGESLDQIIGDRILHVIYASRQKYSAVRNKRGNSMALGFRRVSGWPDTGSR
jgi:hypothetical protein